MEPMVRKATATAMDMVTGMDTDMGIPKDIIWKIKSHFGVRLFPKSKSCLNNGFIF